MKRFLIAALALLGGCASLGPPLRIEGIPSDPDATPSAKAVLSYLAALSSDTVPGVIAGQNIGHAYDFDASSGWDGYPKVIDGLRDATGEVPGLVGVDYEYMTEATPERLSEVNSYLIDYWKAGGLVTINWSPHFPLWRSVRGDRTRTATGPLGDFHFRDLIDPAKPISALWYRKLDVVAGALAELQDAGVVVLWRPMQEMNGGWFWWGKTTSGGGQYQAVWRDMFRYFTQTKHLHNLLWVYSPNPGPQGPYEQPYIDPVAWDYPGKDVVDVVAGTRYSDALDLPDYATFRTWGKPIGVAEYGPKLGGALSWAGSFNTLLYRDKLTHDYPGVAYWVSWHSWREDQGVQHQAMVDNQNVAALLGDPQIITQSRVKWRDFLR
jgi:mannan endo-1,4-beta-mannosidase